MRLLNRLAFRTRSQKTEKDKMLSALRLHGYDLNQLYLIDRGRSGAVEALKNEALAEVLRVFRVPMSLGYLIQHFPMTGERFNGLLEALRCQWLQPIEGVPLQMEVDQTLWDFYRNLTESSPPRQVQVNITNRCVNRCIMCRKYEWPQEEMPVGKFRELAEEVKKMGGHEIVLSGGEPFLHRQFPEILEIAEDLHAAAFTSGVVPLSRDLMKKLKTVIFSVDALDKETYRMIRGPGNVETIRDNILKAKEAGCAVVIAPVIQRMNIFHLPEIAEFCEKEHATFFPTAVHSYDDLAVYHLGDRPLPPLCLVPFYHCLIDSLGDVFVCCYHHEDNNDYGRIDRRFVLGNVFQAGFSEIWHSDRAREIKGRLYGNRAAFCRGCYRYLLENDVASLARSGDGTKTLPFTHTYLFPLKIQDHLKAPE